MIPHQSLPGFDRPAFDMVCPAGSFAPLDAGPTFRQLILDLTKYALVAVPGNGRLEMMDEMVVLAEQQRIENAPRIDPCVEITLLRFVGIVRQEIES